MYGTAADNWTNFVCFFLRFSPVLSSFCSPSLFFRFLHLLACLGTASEAEKRLTMMLFSRIFDSLAGRNYDPELFNYALPCLSAIGSALPPDYALVKTEDDEMETRKSPGGDVMRLGYQPNPVETSTSVCLQSIDVPLDWLIDWFDRLIDLIDWFDCLIDLIERFDWFVRLIDWLIEPMIFWICSSPHWETFFFSRFFLSPDLQTIALKFAEHFHDAWALKQYEAGWGYHPTFNEEEKVHPKMEAYNYLPEQVKDDYRVPTEQACKAILAWGWTLEHMEDGTRGMLHFCDIFADKIFRFWFGSSDFFHRAFSSGARTQMIKRRPSRALQELPHGYVPRPVELNNLTLNREMLALAEKLAENAHDIWSANLKVDTVSAEIVALGAYFFRMWSLRGSLLQKVTFSCTPPPLYTMGFYGGGDHYLGRSFFPVLPPLNNGVLWRGVSIAEGHFFLYSPLWTMGFYGGRGVTIWEGHFFLYSPLWTMGFYGGRGVTIWEGHFFLYSPLWTMGFWEGSLLQKVTFSCTPPFEKWGFMGGGVIIWEVATVSANRISMKENHRRNELIH